VFSFGPLSREIAGKSVFVCEINVAASEHIYREMGLRLTLYFLVPIHVG
jgi:hypothetical protein